jgi:SagB-type dehydrogenase family enzyme
MSVEETIERRRSRRRFAETALELGQLAQLLWCAQGVTGEHGRRRAAPSAGACYPIDLFVAVGPETVGGLDAGVYRYLPGDHALAMVAEGDVRGPVAEACLGQDFLEGAPAVLLMAADMSRTRTRYAGRAARYVHMEVGHIGQNIHLQAESLGLGTVAVGAFQDDAVARAFRIGSGLEPLYVMPLGFLE